ncbi:MAG: RNA polymerase sigma factor [Methyloligellaceae bacterium]
MERFRWNDLNDDGKITRHELPRRLRHELRAEEMNARRAQWLCGMGRSRNGAAKRTIGVPSNGAGSGPRSTPRAGQSDRDIEAGLVGRAAAGDERAFAALVEAHLGPVLSVGRKMLGDDSEAEDVAQETFHRLWKNAGRFDHERARLSTWLYRIAANLCIDRLRGRTVEPLEDVPETGANPEQVRNVHERQLSARMDAALQRLPDRQRLALTLFHYQEFSMKEAAEIMDVSIEAFESLLARARRRIKKDLELEWRTLLPDNI